MGEESEKKSGKKQPVEIRRDRLRSDASSNGLPINPVDSKLELTR